MVVIVPIIVFFTVGFLLGLVFAAGMSPWRFRATTCLVLWAPLAVLWGLQYLEVIEPDTISTIALFTPRAIKYPIMGILVGYALVTLLTAGQASRSD